MMNENSSIKNKHSRSLSKEEILDKFTLRQLKDLVELYELECKGNTKPAMINCI